MRFRSRATTLGVIPRLREESQPFDVHGKDAKLVKQYFIHILANKTNTTLYTGMTSNLLVRVWQHQHKGHPGGFSSRYQVNKLVYFETFDDPRDAIAREKQIKSWSRYKKDQLIDGTNPGWDDLSAGWYEESDAERATLP